MPKLTLGSTSDPKLKDLEFHSHIKLIPHLGSKFAIFSKIMIIWYVLVKLTRSRFWLLT